MDTRGLLKGLNKNGMPIYTRAQREADNKELENRRALAHAQRTPYVCARCNCEIRGRGSNNAIYCTECWDYVLDGYKQRYQLTFLLRTEMPLITPKAFHRKLYKARRSWREVLSAMVEKYERTGKLLNEGTEEERAVS